MPQASVLNVHVVSDLIFSWGSEEFMRLTRIRHRWHTNRHLGPIVIIVIQALLYCFVPSNLAAAHPITANSEVSMIAHINKWKPRD